MADTQTPFARVRGLEAHIIGLLTQLDLDDLPLATRELLGTLKHMATDVRLDIRDYGMAETKAQQDRSAREARTRLAELDKLVAKAGELSVFSPVDVAYLSAHVQQLMSDL